ncbi:uncharacterized protein ASCRUDRAFT_74614 [Ascoidea rubescens DSM 1968]|uniref:Uncharacterized protein n=1 Tax=Ascoidea rubescens DSM 1968 TaxID=1344418 RepID=A0A1D2VKP2_9ASCO|nr:hypothetical protein ASCRUDRAFT_74614 [Ascoidea rubescens DSM 1968]ODV62172.1 hypothetical protein ASCRUDRAFT_74614 [Ascoidea rubescens DSM 1968]
MYLNAQNARASNFIHDFHSQFSKMENFRFKLKESFFVYFYPFGGLMVKLTIYN